jgi:hypothetical protein
VRRLHPHESIARLGDGHGHHRTWI